MEENKNIVKCKACGKRILRGTKKCPYCGEDQRDFIDRHSVIISILIIICGVIFISWVETKEEGVWHNRQNKSAQTENETRAVVSNEHEEAIVSAVDLSAAYAANKILADKSYIEKTAVITGRVKIIGDTLTNSYIILDSEKEFSTVDIQCFFEDITLEELEEKIHEGDNITVKGVITGKSINVEVENCELIN